MALPLYVNLKSVPIDGWLDEDGEQVTSAVVVAAEAPAKAEKQDRLSKHKKLFESAWWASGAEEREEAFGVLVRYSQHRNEKLAVVASEVVRTRTLPDDV